MLVAEFQQSTINSNMKSILPVNQNDDENEESFWSSYDSWLVSLVIVLFLH
jgi:hypothetical protein